MIKTFIVKTNFSELDGCSLYRRDRTPERTHTRPTLRSQMMKLDDLTPLELECYEAWGEGCADRTGGDCQTIGFAWCAFDDDRVVIVEDDQGFVDADTYDATDGTGETAYARRVAALEAIWHE